MVLKKPGDGHLQSLCNLPCFGNAGVCLTCGNCTDATRVKSRCYG
nr:MAG TPA: 4Fe-4S binding domain protein [Bacteriophage sp.]